MSTTNEDHNRSKSPLGGNKKGGRKEVTDEEMLDQMEQNLRASYQTYMDYVQRCQVELKSQSHLGIHVGTKKTKFFYFPPKIPLLDDPEKQRAYRKQFISEVAQGPEPEPLILMGDVLHQRLQEIIGDRSSPSTVRKDLSAFFKRRLAQLNIKKNKMISRWVFHSRMSVPDLEKNGILLEKGLGKLQQEIDLTINRVDRLSQNDFFGNPNNERPIPATRDDKDPSKVKALYEEKEEPVACSTIRDDDIEVYLRMQTYRNKLFRIFDKFITELTWLPYFSRFEIYEESRIFIQDYKHETYDYMDGLRQTVSNSIRKKLEKNGIIEERIVYAIVEKFIKNIKGPDGGSSKNMPRFDYLMNSHKANHERPPILVGTIIEMKIHLQKIAKTFIGASMDEQTLELDNGYMFSYRITSMLPTHFQQQTLQLQFDHYDTSKENDYITTERVVKNLDQLEKQDRIRAVEEMKHQTQKESKKSMIGRINAEEMKAEDARVNHRLEKTGRENHVEENFFNMDPTSTKLKKADWLDLVCFEGTVSEVVKRQSFHFNLIDQYDSLLESAFNFLDVNDQSAVNRILEDSASTHVQRAQQRQLTKFEQPNKISEDDELEQYLNIALQRAGQAKLQEMSKEQAKLLKEQVKGAEQPLQLADPIPNHLIKSYYTIRLLKSREAKIKLLHTLNCFRSAQKRIAIDIKEIFSRNRKQIVPNDCELITPQFEKNEILSKIKFQDESLAGPGNILLRGVQRPQDTMKNEFYELKTLKYNKQFNPRVSSTCPCVPRYHVTFERPRLYEEYSDQIDRGEIFQQSLIRRHEGKQDKWDIDEDQHDVIITDDYGVKIMYQEALNDMVEIEEELIKVGTYFINQAECRADLDIKEPASAIDRGDVAYHLIEKEAEFQFQKLLIIAHYMESYEHTNDPLELLRLSQLIADIMVMRPRHNVEGSYFIDSYRSEIEVLKQKRELLRELIDFQINLERETNEELRLYNELKFRKINDFLSNDFKYSENLPRIQMPGVHEEDRQKRLNQMNSALNQGENETAVKELTLEEMLDQNKQAEEVKRKRIMEIAARHQSEFIDNQYADFEELLGMEEIEKTQQSKKEPNQLDPSTIDQLRESAFFNKQMDGNAWLLERDPLNQYNLFGESSHRVGVFDFLESISTLSKVEAALQQGLSELISVHMPENGLAVSSIERAMLIEARGRLKVVRNNEPLLTQSKNLIENDLYLGNSDKMMFLMKEFKAHLSPQLIKSKANPFLVSKLDVKNMSKFNFPRVKQKDLISEKEQVQLTPEQILHRMIALAKVAVTGSSFDALLGGDSKEKKSDPLMDMLFNSDKDSDEKVVKSPSLMVMSCNLIEALRIREEIIQKIYETDVLSVIYKKQLTLAGKGSTKLMLLDQISFDTSKIMGDSMNLIDYNDGSTLDLDLPFREFDNTLRSILNFSSESCIKALMTELGLEELRAILHYQTMQMQLIQIGISINQVMFDGGQKALSEIEFLGRKKPFTVPNPILNLHNIIAKTTEGHMGEQLMKEKSKFRSLISREAGDMCYLIDGKKNRLRHAFSQKFSLSVTRLSSNLSVDVKLRLLRSQRIKFLHCYCREVLKEAYQDSLKTQLLTTANHLRQLSMVFPKDQNPFHYGVGNIQENFSLVFIQENPEKFDKETMRINQISQHYLEQVLDGEVLLFVPSSEEIMKLEPLNRSGSMDVGIPGGDTVNEQAVDIQIKELSSFSRPLLNKLKVDEGLLRNYRMVGHAHAYSHTSQSFRLLNFLSLMTRNVKLLYLMYRNSSSGMEILDLESHILNGRPYWNQIEQLLTVKKEVTPSFEMQSNQNQLSEKIIKEIVSRRKARQNLSEDLNGLARKLAGMNQWLTKARATSNELAHGKFNRLIELLNIQHSILHKRFIVGVDSIVDTYIDKQNDECLMKSLVLRDQITRKLPGLLRYYENGFNMNQVSLQSMCLNLGARSLTDDYEHEKINQAFTNEDNLMPMELELIKSMFNKFTYYETNCSHSLIKPFMRDYAYLENSFLNFKDEQRQYAFTNFTGIDLKVRQYLKYRGLSFNENSIKDLMLAELDYLQNECDARHIQAVLLCWLERGDIPRESRKLTKLLKRYKDETMLKIIEERDKITVKDKERQAAEKAKKTRKEDDDGVIVTDAPTRLTGAQLPPGHSVDRASMNEALDLNEDRIHDHHFVTSVFEKKAEIIVGKRYLEFKMMKHANQMFHAEHSSLLALYEQTMTEKEIAAFIHPDQQFAGSLSLGADEKIKDPYKGLDVCHKLASVQQFLTRLRNRCSEVETLTSGTGIVFSLRDFNECVQLMCRSLVKYGEEELKQRADTTAIMTMQYRHLLYLQQRQTEYYRAKCDHFLREMDKLVGAKLSQRGNQIIYELDLASRELRTVKDNVYIMERRMRQELRHEYERSIMERENESRKYKESFVNYKSDLNNQMIEVVASRINEAQIEIKNMVMKKAHEPFQSKQIARQSTLNAPQAHLNIDIIKDDSDPLTLMTPGDIENGKQGNYYDQEAVREINSLSRFFRRYKIFQRFKELVQREKYERDLQIQKEKLTSNQCLWEQLSEAEKRENIIRQELYFAQQNLSTYEKIIGKLQHQLETLQNEKLRLLQFKATKSKQIEAMESKIRDVEILENIDLQKVIDELQSREKKLKQLQAENVVVNERIQKEQVFNERRVIEIKKKLENERDMKVHAFDQLEAMRLEIKAIEGKDMSNSDLWKQKCKELFDICKDLQKENDDLKSGAGIVGARISSAQFVPTQHIDTQVIEDAQQYYSMAPIQSATEQNTLHQRDNSLKRTEFNTLRTSQDPTTKPSTAGAGKRPQQRQLSRGGSNHPGTAPGGPRQHIQHPWSGHPSQGTHPINHTDLGASATLTSGLSLPEIMMMGPGGQNSSIPNDQSDGGNQSSSPLSSTILNQKSGRPTAGYTQLKSREHVMKPITNQNTQMMNSNEIFQMHRHHMNQASGTSSDQLIAQNKRKQQGRSSIRSGIAGVTMASGYQTVSAGLRLADMSDEGSTAQLPHTQLMVLGGEMKSVGGPVARSTAGITFASNENPNNSQKAQTRITSGNNQQSSGGANLIANKNQQQNKRLMTSQGPRRGNMAIVPDPSTTGTLYSTNLQNTRELGGTGLVMMGGPPSIRKSLAGVQPPSSNTSRGGFIVQGQNQAMMAATSGNLNLAAGMAIANNSLPVGPAQIMQQQQQKQSVTQFQSQQPINFNINFNTTNFNLK